VRTLARRAERGARKLRRQTLLRALSGVAEPGLSAGVRMVQDARTHAPAESKFTARRPASRVTRCGVVTQLRDTAAPHVHAHGQDVA
jgi:hypothetical protein